MPTKRAWVTASERASTAVGEERWEGSTREKRGVDENDYDDAGEREREREREV